MRTKKYETIAEYQKHWREQNKEHIKQKEREYAQKKQEKLLYHQAKSSAKRRNIDFSITENDITIPDVCPILGITLTKIRGNGRIKSNVSIDRIDSTIGYTPENIWIISDLANRMKSNATQEELLAFAKGILKLYGTTDS